MNFIDRYIQEMDDDEMNNIDLQDADKEQLQNYIANLMFKPQKSTAEMREETKTEFLHITDMCIEAGNKFLTAYRGRLSNRMITDIFRSFIETVMRVSD